MALETLKGIEQIGDFVIRRCEWEHPPDHFIEVNDTHNAITFKMQNGPAKENGENGCQVDTLIEAAKLMVEGLNKQFPCSENVDVISRLDSALAFLRLRRMDRVERGVEGTSAT